MLLDGKDISSYPSKEVARRLGLLPQSSTAPDGITVADLVARGRYPHQRLLRQWSRTDEQVVAEALAATGVDDLADRAVDELSGGQRQRVWLAMALAQQTPILLLDEPTTYLDIAHQIEMLDLCADLHAQQGRTMVAVLHDLNHACRYATHLIAMRAGDGRRGGQAVGDRHRRARRGRLRAGLPGDRRPGNRYPADHSARQGRAAVPGPAPPRRAARGANPARSSMTAFPPDCVALEQRSAPAPADLAHVVDHIVPHRTHPPTRHTTRENPCPSVHVLATADRG